MKKMNVLPQSDYPPFPIEEFEGRLKRLRAKMEELGLDVCLFSSPESIYYLTGLNHWGFFALHVLIVPQKGELSIVIREMESFVIKNQLGTRVAFKGYKDGYPPALKVVEVLTDYGFTKAAIGIDMQALYRSYADTKQLMENLPKANWQDAQELIYKLLFIKSPLEIEATKKAGKISEIMMRAAFRTAGVGVKENEVAAEVYKDMVLAGGEYPSFGPFIRPNSRLGEEHGAWAQSTLTEKDRLFVELSGSFKRYHAPMGRFIYLKPPRGLEKVKNVTTDAFRAVTDTIKPGMTAHEVYMAWQKVVDKAGAPEYKRHHCGYMTGMSFPPSWMSGGNKYTLREGSDMVLKKGMVFHILSWLVGSRLGDYFVSDTVVVTAKGCERVINFSQDIMTAN